MLGKLKRNLAPDLYYHGVHHIHHVLLAADLIAAHEKLNSHDLFLLKVAVLYHDSGFMKSYSDHENVSCDIARADLPGFGLNTEEIEIICEMIRATEIPPQPKTQLEKIIVDADLEYLGTDSFNEISNTLFEEAKIYRNVVSKSDWDKIQVQFLTQHRYYTKFCRQNREPEKRKHLDEVKARL